MSFWASFGHYVEKFAPLVLSGIPGVPAAIAPYVAIGIQSAESIKGATGQQKLAAAVQIAQAGFTAAQAAGAHVDAAVENQALSVGVSAVVDAVNGFKTKTQ